MNKNPFGVSRSSLLRLFIVLFLVILTTFIFLLGTHGSNTNSSSGKIITRGNIYTKMIALTFDSDTPDKTTSQILDILKSKQVRSTMFLTGKMIATHPDIAKRLIADGHEVGNHGYSHTHADELTDQQFADEMNKTRTLFFQTTGTPMVPLWRPPGFTHYRGKIDLAKNLGFGSPVIASTLHDIPGGLSLDSFDWLEDKSNPNYYTAEQIKDRLLQPINKNGGIILFHMQSREGDPMVSVLPQIIDGLRAQGYEIVTLSELLDMRSN